jgi:hypothetical protein
MAGMPISPNKMQDSLNRSLNGIAAIKRCRRFIMKYYSINKRICGIWQPWSGCIFRNLFVLFFAITTDQKEGNHKHEYHDDPDDQYSKIHNGLNLLCDISREIKKFWAACIPQAINN